VNRRHARIVTTLMLLLLGATLLGEARAQACAPACCCPAAEHADGDCAALAGSCCHAGEAPGVPSGASAPGPGPAAPVETFAAVAGKLPAARVLPFSGGADLLPAALRFSVVLRI
jgi:hypothetical protein